MRISLVISLAIVFAACESKSKSMDEQENTHPPVPTMSAAPTAEELRNPPPEEPEQDEHPPVPTMTAPDDAPSKKSGVKRRQKSGVGGLGTSGSGRGGGGDGQGGVDTLLEARAPATWTLKFGEHSGPEATQRALNQRVAAMQRCLSFFGDDVRRVSCTVKFDGGAAKSVSTKPAKDTAAECLRTQLEGVRFDDAPKTLHFEFQR